MSSATVRPARSAPGAGVSTAPAVTEFGPTDFTYLHTDTDSRHGHWAMALELEPGDPALTLDAVRARVRERVSLFDLFRIGVREGRELEPEIVLHDDVDVDRHVTEGQFTDRDDLYRRIAGLLEQPLPRPDPFWSVTLLTSSETGDQVILLKVHHSLSDGIAGAAFAGLLADVKDGDFSEFERFATSPRFRTGPIDPDLLHSSRVAFEKQWMDGEAGRDWPALTESGQREIALYRASTRTLRRAAKAHDASVHEFLLGAIAKTLSVAAPNGEGPQSESIRVTLPVTLDQSFRHTGNAVAISLLNLLGSESDLNRHIDRARAELAIVESSRMELALVANDQEPAPPWAEMREIVAASMDRMSPDIHIGINPGFTRVRSALGRKIAALTPLSPLVGYSFSVTCLILGGTTTFGIVADPAALPGYPARFIEAFDAVIAEATPAQ